MLDGLSSQLNDFGNISPLGLSSDLITNGDFVFPNDPFSGWDVINATYSGISTVGAILEPTVDYNIKQDVSGDPNKYYRVKFQATLQLQIAPIEIDGFVRIQIVDKITNAILLDETELVNNVITPRYYNVNGIDDAEVRFYAIGRSISLIGVSITDGPLMFSNRTNSVDIYDFKHSYDGWVKAQFIKSELSTLHQDTTTADGLILSPGNSEFKLESVLTVDRAAKSIFIHQPMIDEVAGVLLSNTDDISDIDFGYENGILTFYYCTNTNSSNAIKKFNSSGSISSFATSGGYQIVALKKELNGSRIWFATSNVSILYEMDTNNPTFPTSFGYTLDIDVKAIAHDKVSNDIFSVGQDRTFLPDIKSSVYRTQTDNFGITTKIFTVDGLYTSIECIDSLSLNGEVTPFSGRIIIGGDKTVLSTDPNAAIIVLEQDGTIDFSFGLPEIEKVTDLSSIQLSDGRRSGVYLLVTDSVLGQVFTLDVRNRHYYRHYYYGDCVASLQPFFQKAPRAVETTLIVDQSKWYVIDTDVVDTSWGSDGPISWTRPVNIYTIDGRIKNADPGQSGSDIYQPSDNIESKRKSTNLGTRILYRPSSSMMTLGIDCGELPDMTNLLPRDDNNYIAKVHGVSISEIDLNSITPINQGQIKEIFTFDNGPLGWTSDVTLYDNVTQSLRIPSIGKLSKTFNVRKFKKAKIGINLNINDFYLKTENVFVAVNGVVLFTNLNGEYVSVVNKTGYFEAEFTPQTDEITIDIYSSNGAMKTNYICLCYNEPSDLFDPCALQDVRVAIKLDGVPLIPYNFYGFAMRYTLRDYQDPLIRGTVTVTQNPFNLSIVGGQPVKCYVWAQNPVNTMFNIDNMLNTAIPNSIVNTTNNLNLIWPFRNDSSVTSGYPVVNMTFPLYYQNVQNRMVSGNPICTQHEDSQFFKPCVVESMELLVLMASAPNLPKSYVLFGLGCGNTQTMNVNLSYLKDGEVVRKYFDTSFNLISALQVVGSGSQPPNNQDNGTFWDQGVPARMPQARWESFKVDLDLPSGDGVDQCTPPIEGFVIEGSASFNINSLTFKQTGLGGGTGNNVCVVSVIVETISDGSISPAVVKITLQTPDGGTWRIVYGDETSSNITPPLAWNITSEALQIAISGLSGLSNNSISVTGQFPVYTIYFSAGVGQISDITIINNLTCELPPLNYVNPGPYSYSLPMPGANTGVDNDTDNCNICLPVITETIKLRRESVSVGCFDGSCSSPIKTMICRFVNNFDKFGCYKYNGTNLVQLSDDYEPIPGDNIVLLDNSIGLSNVSLDKIKRSFLYV